MNEHLTADDLQRFRAGAMTPSDTAAAARHLAACGDCARSAAELASRDVDAGWLAQAVAGEAEHPESETIVDFVRGTLDAGQRRGVRDHLSACAMCSREVDELKTDVAPAEPRVAFRIAAAIAAALVIAMAWLLLVRKPVSSPPHTPPVARTPQEPPRSAEAKALVADALAGHLERPRYFDELRPHADVPRHEGWPGSSTDVTMTPAGTVVESQTPQFAWTAEGRSYVVTILDGSRIVERSGPLSERHWTPPRPLPRGRTYEWQIEVHDAATRIVPAPPAPPAFFRVADAASLQPIESVRRDHPDDHLLLGVLYARAGLQREAEAELSRYTAQHPADARARQLLASIGRW
jgi:anti-sigma factor RsiW